MEPTPLVALFAAFFSAYLLSELCHYFRVPRVVGQVSAGLLVGALFAGSAVFNKPAQDLVSSIADIGIVLLFFFIGLSTSARQFVRYFKTSAAISLFNTAIPLAAGFAASAFLGYDLTTSVIIGIACAVSAQAVSVDLLDELGLLKSKIGILIVTAGAVDDVFELLLIAVILVIINTAVLGVGLAALAGQVILFVLLLVLLRFIILPRFVQFLEKEHSQIGLFSGALLITLFVAAAADLLNVGALIGALFAGLILREVLFVEEHRPWEAHSIAKHLHLIAFGFFVPVFFVWVGFNANLQLILENLPFAILLTSIAIAGTVGGTILGALFAGRTFNEGVAAGWGLNPKGDAELLIALIALKSGLITQGIFSAIVFMALVTTLISPVIFEYCLRKHPEVTQLHSKRKVVA